MKKQLLMLFSLTLMIFSVHAYDLNVLSIQQITPDPLFSTQLNHIDYNIVIENDDSNPQTTNLILNVDYTDINAFNITIPAQTTTNYIISWNSTILPFSETTHVIKAKIESSPADDNSQNNYEIMQSTIYQGYDLQAITINLPNTMILHQTYDVNIQFKSNDYKIFTPFIIEVKDQNNTIIYHQLIPYLSNNEIQTKTFNYYTDQNNFTLTMFIDSDNRINEYDETNNHYSINKVISNQPDIAVSNVHADTNTIFVGQASTIYFDLKNIGGIEATNFITAAYYTNENMSNNLFWQTIPSIQSGETKTYSFSYTPQVSGTIKIIIRADVNGVLTEPNKTNNYYETTIQAVMNTQTTQSFLTAVNLWRACNVSLSNGDTISNKGFDENFTHFLMIYTNHLGDIMYNDYVESDQQIQMTGVTAKVIYVSNGQAQVVLAFSQQTNVLTNTCDLDYGSMSQDINTMTANYIECAGRLNAGNTLLNTCTADKETCLNNKGTCDASNSLLQTSLTICDGNITNLSASFEQNLTDRITVNNLQYQKQIEALNQTIAQDKTNADLISQDRDLWQIVTALVLICCAGTAGYLVYKRRYEVR